MHTGVHRPHPPLSMPPMTQLRLAPSDDYRLSSYMNLQYGLQVAGYIVRILTHRDNKV